MPCIHALIILPANHAKGTPDKFDLNSAHEKSHVHTNMTDIEQFFIQVKTLPGVQFAWFAGAAVSPNFVGSRPRSQLKTPSVVTGLLPPPLLSETRDGCCLHIQHVSKTQLLIQRLNTLVTLCGFNTTLPQTLLAASVKTLIPLGRELPSPSHGNSWRAYEATNPRPRRQWLQKQKFPFFKQFSNISQTLTLFTAIFHSTPPCAAVRISSG